MIETLVRRRGRLFTAALVLLVISLVLPRVSDGTAADAVSGVCLIVGALLMTAAATGEVVHTRRTTRSDGAADD